MKHIFATTALASSLALGTFMASGIAVAQDSQPSTRECVGENCPGAGMKDGGDQGVPGKRLRAPSQDNQMEGQSDDQVMPRRKRVQGAQQDDDQVMPPRKRVQGAQQDNDDVDVSARVRVGESRFRFDPNRHQRRRSKSASFRFYYGGYWYPEPYWEVYSVRPRYRISCGEGRSIVAERFNRVRVIECSGGTYTYLGRRQGDTYRVIVNARSGRIVGRALI